ncbi:DUF2917 domain-containing protein [Chitinibacteraceae bacterium HSL-7]
MLTDCRFELAGATLLSFDVDSPTRLSCMGGAVWATVSGSSEDIVLYAGQSREILSGRVLVQGEGVLDVCVTSGVLPRLAA